MYAFLVSLMDATRSSHFNHLDLFSRLILGEGTTCEGLFHTIFFIPCYLVYFTSKNSPQHFVFKYPEHIFFPQSDRSHTKEYIHQLKVVLVKDIQLCLGMAGEATSKSDI
jgi:hypothetical protein